MYYKSEGVTIFTKKIVVVSCMSKLLATNRHRGVSLAYMYALHILRDACIRLIL
jgi:hypothetical protein